MNQFLVQVFAYHHHGHELTFRNEGRELQTRNREQEYVHAVTQNPRYLLFGRAILANIGAGGPRWYQRLRQPLQHADEIAVDPAGHGHEVIPRLLAVSALEPGVALPPINAGNQFAQNPRALLNRHALQVTVEAFPRSIPTFARAVAAVKGGDALLAGGAADIDAAHVHVHDVGLDAALHHFRRQADALGSQDLHHGFRDYATTMVTTGRPATVERSRLENIDLDIDANGSGHLKQEERKKELAGPPPTTAIREPSVKANPDSSPVASDDKESATDVCRESLIPFGFDTPRYVIMSACR